MEANLAQLTDVQLSKRYCTFWTCRVIMHVNKSDQLIFTIVGKEEGWIMRFDEILALVDEADVQDNHYKIPGIPKDWSQGRTVFGGVTSSLAFAAIRRLITDNRALRSIAVNFVGPVSFEKPFEILSEKLREGRSVTHATARVVQDGKVCLIAQACFGVGRDSKVAHSNEEKHEMTFPKKPGFLPQIPKVVPKYLRHFDLALEKGMPFTGRKDRAVHGWIRFKEAPEAINDAHLLAMIDAWPPTGLQNLRWPAPVSSLSWYVDFVYPHRTIEPNDWFAYQAEARQASNGYIHEEANFWNAHGDLVAISHQTITIFD